MVMICKCFCFFKNGHLLKKIFVRVQGSWGRGHPNRQMESLKIARTEEMFFSSAADGTLLMHLGK